MNSNRDNFSSKTVQILAQRVNGICSKCFVGTTGPSSDGKVINNGVAAHICAAAPGGPRYDPNMTKEERSSQDNGIWLCSNCSKIIDRDPKRYTVEILKEMKKNAEERADRALNQSRYEITSLDDIVVSIDKSKESNEQPILNIEDSNIFLGVSKEYLKSFEPLNDYIYCNYYSNSYANFFNKNFNNEDKNLIFCKDLIDWVMGIKKFPLKKLYDFYNNCDLGLSSYKSELLKKRHDALYYFFAGKLDKAKDIYLSLKDDKNFDKLEQWFKDDILIDGRNILIRIKNNSKGYLENVFQIEIEKNNYNINYPNADRLKCDLYENVIKHIFDYQNKSKYTQFYGIGLQYILNSIQNLIYITITFGSITHLLLVRKTIAEIMSIYANCYDDELFYRLTLKEKILTADYKDFKKIYEKIKLKYRFVDSNEFIAEILKLEKALLPYNLDEYSSFIFDVYGRYLEDNIFKKYENKILSIISSRKPTIIKSNALKAIPSNVDRFFKKEELFQKLLTLIKNRRFYSEIENIISNIKFLELSEQEQSLFIILIEKCSYIKEINIIDSALDIRKSNKKIKKFDYLFSQKGTAGYLFYNLSNNNKAESLSYIVNELTKRANEREETPSTHKGYGVNYTIGTDLLESQKERQEITKIINESIFPLSKIILHSKNQYAIEKIKMLKVLANIYLKHNNYESLIKNIVDNIELECPKVEFSIYKSKNDLQIYILLFKFIFEEITLFELLSQYLFLAIDDAELLVEISECLIILNKYKKIVNINCITLLYSIYNLGINSEDFDIRKSSIKISPLFVNSKFFECILNDLLILAELSNFNESIAICNMVYAIPRNQRNSFIKVICKMEESRNYNIRYIVNKYFKNH